MSSVEINKEQAVIDFLLTCPELRDNPVFFNFLKAKDNNKQIVTQAQDRSLNRKFIDGSELKRLTFSIIDYRSVSYQALVKAPGYPNENVMEYLDIQGIINWIDLQNDIRNYPNFGSDCIIDEMTSVSDNPNLNGVDTNVTPALAKYSITIQIDYLDTTKAIYK